jgi:hypothetical protein
MSRWALAPVSVLNAKRWVEREAFGKTGASAQQLSMLEVRAQLDLLTRVTRGLMLDSLAPSPPGSSC